MIENNSAENKKLQDIEKKKSEFKNKIDELKSNFKKTEDELKEQIKILSKEEKKIKDKLARKDERIFCNLCNKSIDKYMYDKHLESQKHKLKLYENKN
jgi:hypothetical protein